MTSQDVCEEDRVVLSALRDSADDFFSNHVDHGRTRALRYSIPGYDSEILQKMARLGWFGILVPEEFGGSGLGFAEFGVIVEAAGRALLAEPLVPALVLGNRALLHTGHALGKELLPPTMRGEDFVIMASQEAADGCDMAAPKTVAADNSENSTLTGRKRFVAGASAAGGFLVTARAQHATNLYWLSRSAPGVELGTEWRIDGTPSGVLTLTDAPARKIAEGAEAEAALQSAFDEAIVMTSAELFGIVTESIVRTSTYLQTRMQFDKPIGSFQSLQHRLVDLYILQEISHSVLRDAVNALDDRTIACRERAQVASRAKARLSDAALRVTRDAIQLHGAIGYTDEHDIGLFLKRALVLSAWLGNAEMHRRRFMKLSSGAREGSDR